MEYSANKRVSNIIFISSLVPPATSISFLRALISFKGYNTTIISDVENSEFSHIKIRKGFFDIRKDVNSDTDLVLFIEGGSFQLFPLNIDKVQTKTAWYGIDTHTNYKKHVAISKLFDVTFLAQKGYVDSISEVTNKIVSWLPLAFDGSILSDKNENNNDRKFDIAYVGSLNRNVHPIRISLIDKIRRSNLKQFIGMANSSEMYSIYRNSICVFNYSVNNDLNMRVFESVGNGSFLFTNKITGNGLEELFQEGVDYKLFTEDTFDKDLEELSNQIHKINLLSNSRAQKIGKYHKYSNRVNALFGLVNSIHIEEVEKSNDADVFDYIRVAYLNKSFKIACQIFFNHLTPANNRQKLLLIMIKKFLK
jgi:hypothetical protein